MKGYTPKRNNWADTYLRSRLWFLPSSVLVFIVFAMLVGKMWGLYVMVGGCLALAILDKFGITLTVMLLTLRSRIAGKHIKRRRSVLNKTID